VSGADGRAGSRVVLVHGVGIGPWSYAALADDLAADHDVVIAHRRGYGANAGQAAPDSLRVHVEDLRSLAAGRAAFVGVSGGATLVLALALAHPDVVSAAVVHEPVVGPLAPELHAELRAAATRLSSSAGPAGTVAFVRALVGRPAWDRLDEDQVSDVRARDTVVRAEVPLFLDFAPRPAELRALAGMALVSSVGATSRRSRHAAAAAVAAHTACSRSILPGVGHLAQVEDPAGLARALRRAEDVALRGAEDIALRRAGEIALQRRAGHHEQVLAPGRGDQLQADG
jgi:pimeloyl-ACP methyl ester carboxylesterase